MTTRDPELDPDDPSRDAEGADPEIPHTLVPQDVETVFSHKGDTVDQARGVADGLITATGQDEAVTVEARATRPVSVAAQLKTRLGIDAANSVSHGELSGDIISGPSSQDRYRVIAEIGRGGMGAILKLMDNDIRRPVAMKLIIGHDDPDRIERFVAEAQITGQLEHPNIVPVHELGLNPAGKVYFTMKMVKGESLEQMLERLEGTTARGSTESDLAPDTRDGKHHARKAPAKSVSPHDAPRAGKPGVRRGGTRSLTQLLQIFLKVCDAVAFAHNKGVIHRDLKPENIMVGRFGEVLVMDWGLAKVKGTPDKVRDELVATVRSDSAASQSISGDVMGTPSYMPPEQADGRVEDIDERSDIFSLGGILYRILAQAAPYTGSTMASVMAKAVLADIEPPSRRSPRFPVPPELESICLKAMSPDKNERYLAVSALTEDIQAYLDRRLVSVHAYSPWARVVRFIQRHPTASIAGGVALFLIAAASGLLGIMEARNRAQASRAEAEAAMRREAEIRAENEGLRAESAEQKKRLAEQRAADAVSALSKSRAASAVMRLARIELGETANQLKRTWLSFAKDEEKRALFEKLWPRIEAFEKHVPQDPTSRATWASLKGWFCILGADLDGAKRHFDQARVTDPDVAYPYLFSAMVDFTRYLYNQMFPAYTVDQNGFRFHRIPAESGKMKTIRERYEATLAKAGQSKVWGEFSFQDFLEALQGFRRMHRNDLEGADEGFSRALSVPELVWIREELLYARAQARILGKRFDDALSDLERVAEVNGDNLGVLMYTAQAYLCRGHWLFAQGKDRKPSMEAAVEVYDRITGLYPGHWNSYSSRGMARLALAQDRVDQDQDPSAMIEAALADYDKALSFRPPYGPDYNHAVAYNGRGNVHLTRALWEWNRGRDPLPDLESALTDYLDAVRQRSWHSTSIANLANVFGYMVRYHAGKGTSGLAELENRAERLAAKVAAGPPEAVWKEAVELAYLQRFLARPHAEMAAFQEAARGYEIAGKPAFESWISRNNLTNLQRYAEAAEKKASGPAWGRLLDRASLLVTAGELERARSAFEQGLKEAEKADREDEKTRARLVSAHYNYACVMALLSSGAAGPSPGTTPPTTEEVAAFRRAAFDHLGQAVALGWTDRDHLENDPDLESLRKDLRFAELLDKITPR